MSFFVIEMDKAKAEIDRLRSERDKWMEYATGDRADLALKMEALRAELAVKDGIIANLKIRSAQYKGDCVAKDARIAELERLLAYGTDTSEYRRIRARAERAEARIAELADKGTLQALRDANDRAEQAEAHLGGYLEVLDRAERAEAAHEQQVIVAANYAERAEQAEAELKRVPLWIAGHGYATGHGDTVEDMLAELVADVKERAEADLKEWICCAEDRRKDRDKAEAELLAERSTAAYKDVRAERAEAERDAMREALEMLLDDAAHHETGRMKARAALNPSTRQGREG